MRGWFRFRRFRTRLLVLLVGLLAAVQVTTYVIVSRANRANALETINADLARAARQFAATAALRENALLFAAKQMAGDYAMKQLFLADEFSAATARSALVTYRTRIEADVIALLAPDGTLYAGLPRQFAEEELAPFRALIEPAENSEQQHAASDGYFGQALHQIVLVPLLAPPPEIVAWIGLSFPIDEAAARALKASANVEVTFLRGGDAPAALASTLPAERAAQLAALRLPPGETRQVTLAGEIYIATVKTLPIAAGEPASIALLRSLDEQLAPSRLLEQTLLATALAGLVLAILASLALARNVSRPVQQLAEHTGYVAVGDYSRRLELPRADEFGQLARSFNLMTAGLAERDRVRDLLGKVVSPEIATQLLQSEVQLGGEEREVTILFSDLRDFTTLSEKLPPQELLALLNRYLDRMSAIVEKHGGVIDKYIGDAIMALFGAPVAMPDAAARAVAAAREMTLALDALNRELAAENKPPLAVGIGINTARVIAGNMGSHTRLNYTVVGDGVNLAARLEALTKETKYATRIIVSEATAQRASDAATTQVNARSTDENTLFRPLGDVTVKGKTASVQIFAVD